MMNQYSGRYTRSGLRSPRYGEAAPYRAPQRRSGMMPPSVSRPVGCGCGVGDPTRAVRQNNASGSYRSANTGTVPACASPARERNGCGCEGGVVRSDCKKLMEQIRAVDFALYETILYLDVYPHSCDALETYRKLKTQSEALHAEYEASCAPLTALGNQSDTSWDWMSKPFPWEYDAE